MHKLKEYFKIIFLQYFLVIAARVYEIYSVHHAHSPEHLMRSEAAGMINDFLLSGFFLLLYFPVYYSINKFSQTVSNVISFFILFIVFILKILILQYFIFQLSPLDEFLFQHTGQEVWLTIRTAEVHYFRIISVLTTVLLVSILFFWFTIRFTFPERLYLWFSILFLLSLPVYFLVNTKIDKYVNNDLYLNKPFYFYKVCVRHYFFDKADFEDGKDVAEISKNYQTEFNDKIYVNNTYPFLHRWNRSDVLGNFFNRSDSSPNVVVLIVEGLADDFIHPFHGLNLMPFLDSLSGQSLYWDHFLSLGERSYAVTPSLIGSLPYGNIGFTILENQPYHFSFVNLLKANGYYTSFYYGQGAWFHQKDVFYNKNCIDRIIDKMKFDRGFNKIIVNPDSFFWGYNDKYLFMQSEKEIEKINGKKRLDIYFTGTMHSPFTIEENERYEAMLAHETNQPKNKEEQIFYSNYKKFLLSVMFTNDALKDFFDWYKKRSDYRNTIFLITGDHPMTDIPIQNSIKRYHVPMLIFSPLLKSAKTFHSAGSHLDVMEPFFTFLQNKYKLNLPDMSNAVSSILDTSVAFANHHVIPFMNGNRDIIDIYSGDYMLSNGKDLYKVEKGFKITKTDDKIIFQKLSKQLSAFKDANSYACRKDHLLPDSLYFCGLNIHPYYYDRAVKNVSMANGYHDIIQKVKIRNEELNFDISGNVLSKTDKGLQFICQITNSKDSILYWRSFGIPAEKKPFMFHIKIPGQAINSDSLTFRSFFYNEEKHTASISYKAALYQR